MAIEVLNIPAVITVGYEEMTSPQQSPTEDLPHEGFTATRLLICGWEDRLTLAKELRGYTEHSEDTIINHEAHRYPHNEQLIAMSVSIAGMGVVSSPASLMVAEWTKAVLTVQYAVPEWSGSEDNDGPTTLASESIEPAGEFLTVSGKSQYWDAAKTNQIGEDESIGILVRMADWVFTMHRMTHVPSGSWSLIGHCNSSAVNSRSLNFSFPAETLQFKAPRLSREITSDGYGAWQIEYRFTYRPNGWNKKFNKKTSAWATVYDDNGSAVVYYPKSDFGGFIASIAGS